MAPLPVVSIIGRPNVGKSTLFNRIVRKKTAVTDDMPGVTRDRLCRETSWNGVWFTLVDTGGYIPQGGEGLVAAINRQVEQAMRESDAVIFTVETGPDATDLDACIAKNLRRSCAERTVLAVNKAESSSSLFDKGRFYGLGLGEPILVSALHGSGIGDLLERVTGLLPAIENETNAAENGSESICIAILGRPNAGKSSLVNRLLGNDRMIVDDRPGTTRDAIDSHFTYQDTRITLIDTAGLRKKSVVREAVEYHANLRTLHSIRRCDVCVLLIDAQEGPGEQDLKIVERIHEARKGVVLCWNKWDSIEKDSKTFDHLAAGMRRSCRELRTVPIIAISALYGKRVCAVLDTAVSIHSRMRLTIPPGQLKEAAFGWIRTHPHPHMPNKPVRILGLKQIAAPYPLFHLYASNHSRVHPNYIRYLRNRLYGEYPFAGCPIMIECRPPGRRKAPR